MEIRNLLIICIILAGKSCGISIRDVVEEYLKEEMFLRNLTHSVKHVLSELSSAIKPHYCIFISSHAPGSRPLTITNMVQPAGGTFVVRNFEENETLEICSNCDRCKDVIIFVSKAEDVVKVISKVNLTSGEEAKLLIVICEELNSYERAKKSAKTIVDLAWRHYVQYAIILVPVGSEILVLKSSRHIPFERCRPEPPEVISHWKDNKFVSNLSFEHMRHEKCVIRVASGNCSIFGQLTSNNGEYTLAGVEGMMMETIARKHNFTVEVINAQILDSKRIVDTEEKVPNNYELIVDRLESGEADVGLCSLWIPNTMRVKFSVSYVSHDVILMVPVQEYIPFTSILRTFAYSVWIYITISFVVGRLLLRMNRSRINSLTVLALFLGVSVDLNPQGFLEKSQITLWVVYGYIITQSYIASLSSSLNNPGSRKLQTIEEFAAIDVPVVGPGPEVANFKGDQRYKRIVESYVGLNQLEYTQLTVDPSKITLFNKSMAVLIDILDRERWGSKFYQLKEQITSFPIAMLALTPGRISLEEINPTIILLLENGLIPKWTRSELIKREKQLNSLYVETPSPTLSLDEVIGIFMILVAGLLLSMIVFSLEIWKHKKSSMKFNSRL